MNDILSWLRAEDELIKEQRDDGSETNFGLAADRIEALEAEVARLQEALDDAKKPRFGEPEYVPPTIPTHAYVPHPKYPWFCKNCGYPEHEPLKHPQSARAALSQD